MPFKEKSSLGHLGGMGEKMIPIPAPKCIPKKSLGKLQLSFGGCIRPDPATSPLSHQGSCFHPPLGRAPSAGLCSRRLKTALALHMYIFYSCLYQVCASVVGALITRRKKCARWFCVTDWSINLK